MEQSEHNLQDTSLFSDPNFLLDYMADLPSDEGSDDEFDGYLSPEDDLTSHYKNFQYPSQP